MRTLGKKLLLGIYILITTANVACSSSGGGGDTSGTTTQSAITISPSPANVPVSTSQVIVPFGGVAPYTFTLISTIGGSLSTSSGSFTTFTAGSTAGTVQLSVQSSNGLSGIFVITVTGGSSTLSVSPLNGTVAVNGALPFTVSGGTAPYTYTVLTSGGGYFQSNTYYAPGTAMTVTVRISDSANRTVQTNITVGSGSTGSCAGNYSLNLSGYPGTMTILQSGNNINGSMTIDGGTSNISGTCANGTINFTNTYSGSPYTGFYQVNPSNAAQTIMSGTFQWNGGTFSWFAQSY